MGAGFDAVLIVHKVFEHDLYFCFDIVSGLIAQIEKMLVIGIIVVLLQLDPWVFHIADFNLEAQTGGDLLDLKGQFREVIDLLKLIESPIFAILGGIFYCKSKALHGVTEGQKPTPLMAFTIWS